MRLVVIGLVLAFSTAAYASSLRLREDNSDYGTTGADCTNAASISAGFECNLSGALGLSGQQFAYSGNSNISPAVDYRVFDFQLATDTSNFTLTLSGTLPFAPDQQVDNQPFFGFGMFTTCNTDGNGNPVGFCGPDASNSVSVSPGTSDGTENSVQFTVPGDGNRLTFYVVENIPITTADPTVTATITPNSSTVPEPSSLPLLVSAGITLAVIGRRRSAKPL